VTLWTLSTITRQHRKIRINTRAENDIQNGDFTVGAAYDYAATGFNIRLLSRMVHHISIFSVCEVIEDSRVFNIALPH
jgi:hypothetical protein